MRKDQGEQSMTDFSNVLLASDYDRTITGFDGEIPVSYTHLGIEPTRPAWQAGILQLT